MHLEGVTVIGADRGAVWAALNDPEVLRACIPGCQTLSKTSETSFEAEVKQKVGPVSATFRGVVELSDLNPPESYRISGEGKGGAAGFAKGGADVALAEGPEGTVLTYKADAHVGGKIAQLGARLIDGFAKKMADQFFETFRTQVEAGPGGQAWAAGAAERAAAAQAAAEAAAARSAPPEPVAAAVAAAAPAPAAAQAAPAAAAGAEPKKGFWKRLFG
jgi:carbon monoxide dehydrogenase subunit G